MFDEELVAVLAGAFWNSHFWPFAGGAAAAPVFIPEQEVQVQGFTTTFRAFPPGLFLSFSLATGTGEQSQSVEVASRRASAALCTEFFRVVAAFGLNLNGEEEAATDEAAAGAEDPPTLWGPCQELGWWALDERMAVGRSAQSVAGDGGRRGSPPSPEMKGGSPITEVEFHVGLDTLEMCAAGR